MNINSENKSIHELNKSDTKTGNKLQHSNIKHININNKSRHQLKKYFSYSETDRKRASGLVKKINFMKQIKNDNSKKIELSDVLKTSVISNNKPEESVAYNTSIDASLNNTDTIGTSKLKIDTNNPKQDKLNQHLNREVSTSSSLDNFNTSVNHELEQNLNGNNLSSSSNSINTFVNGELNIDNNNLHHDQITQRLDNVNSLTSSNSINTFINDGLEMDTNGRNNPKQHMYLYSIDSDIISLKRELVFELSKTHYNKKQELLTSISQELPSEIISKMIQKLSTETITKMLPEILPKLSEDIIAQNMEKLIKELPKKQLSPQLKSLKNMLQYNEAKNNMQPKHDIKQAVLNILSSNQTEDYIRDKIMKTLITEVADWQAKNGTTKYLSSVVNSYLNDLPYQLILEERTSTFLSKSTLEPINSIPDKIKKIHELEKQRYALEKKLLENDKILIGNKGRKTSNNLSLVNYLTYASSLNFLLSKLSKVAIYILEPLPFISKAITTTIKLIGIKRLKQSITNINHLKKDYQYVLGEDKLPTRNILYMFKRTPTSSLKSAIAKQGEKINTLNNEIQEMKKELFILQKQPNDLEFKQKLAQLNILKSELQTREQYLGILNAELTNNKMLNAKLSTLTLVGVGIGLMFSGVGFMPLTALGAYLVATKSFQFRDNLGFKRERMKQYKRLTQNIGLTDSNLRNNDFELTKCIEYYMNNLIKQNLDTNAIPKNIPNIKLNDLVDTRTITLVDLFNARNISLGNATPMEESMVYLNNIELYNFLEKNKIPLNDLSSAKNITLDDIIKTNKTSLDELLRENNISLTDLIAAKNITLEDLFNKSGIPHGKISDVLNIDYDTFIRKNNVPISDILRVRDILIKERDFKISSRFGRFFDFENGLKDGLTGGFRKLLYRGINLKMSFNSEYSTSIHTMHKILLDTSISAQFKENFFYEYSDPNRFKNSIYSMEIRAEKAVDTVMNLVNELPPRIEIENKDYNAYEIHEIYHSNIAHKNVIYLINSLLLGGGDIDANEILDKLLDLEKKRGQDYKEAYDKLRKEIIHEASSLDYM